MEMTEKLVAERRARLAAERSLEQLKSELYKANENLSQHARSLSTEIATTQVEVETVRTEAADLKERYEKAETNLRNAKSAITIAERRLWDSLETIRDGFAVFGPDELLIAANRSYLAVFDGLEMVRPGISLSELFALLAEEGIVDTGGMRAVDWKQAMLDRCHKHRIENAILKIWNGTYIKLVDRRTRDGDLVTLALNITDQMVREQQLREATDRAEAANRAKSAFLANMSHEIRTPMNGVIGMADILAETELDEEQKSYLDTIRSSGEALLVIINDVLDYSKIEAEKINLKPRPFDLERCIHDVVTLLAPTAREKGFEIAVDYDLFLPTEYNGDAGRIRQVLTNLVGNAIKFTNDGHVTIQVVGLPEDAEDAYRIHVTVEDTGIGIPEDKLDDVFREFQQVENERNRAHDGTGLGLAITQRLIALMEGEVWVDSTEHEGSVFGFHITLPVVTEVHPSDISAPGWMDRAIVIDRDGMNRSILIKQLGLMGLRSVVADGLDGVAELRPGPNDVVLIGADADDDVVTATRTLRECFAPAAVFLLSDPGRGPRGHVEFNGSLQRPVLRSDITRSLNSVAQPEILAPEVSMSDPLVEAEDTSEMAIDAHPDIAETPVVDPLAADFALQTDATEAIDAVAEIDAVEGEVSNALPETAVDLPGTEIAFEEEQATEAVMEHAFDIAPPQADVEKAPIPDEESPAAAPDTTPVEAPAEDDTQAFAHLDEVEPEPMDFLEATQVAEEIPAPKPIEPSETEPEQSDTPSLDAEETAPETDETPSSLSGLATPEAEAVLTDIPPAEEAQVETEDSSGTLNETLAIPESDTSGADDQPEADTAPQDPEFAPPDTSLAMEITTQEPTFTSIHRAQPVIPDITVTLASPGDDSEADAALSDLTDPFAPVGGPLTSVEDVIEPPELESQDDASPETTTAEIAPPEAPAKPDEMEATLPPDAKADLPEAPLDVGFDASEPEFDLIDTPPEQSAARPMRVLVAEDNRTNRIVIEKMMKALNIDLVFAENGLEAVDQFQWQRPDIIFTDISMPKMDGKEAARRIRQIEAEENLPPCPIVAITAHAMEGDADEILAAGIDHYLTKPVKKAALTEHVLKAQPEGTEPVLESSGEAVA